MNKIAVIPNNPNLNDARIILETNGEYKGWGGGLSCINDIGQLVIFYISGDIQEYKYLAEVTNIDKSNKVFDVKLISKFDQNLSSKFNRKKLLELGLKDNGVIRYYLNSYPEIFQYVCNELVDANILDETIFDSKNQEKVDLTILSHEDILKAMREFDLHPDMCKRRESRNWNLLYNGKKYPHKCIVGRAYNISQNLEGILQSDLYGSICEQNYCASKILKELGFELKEKTNQTTATEGKSMNKQLPLNQILYGSPGTGKTYNTINKALEIIFEKDLGEDYLKLSSEEKEEKLIFEAKNIYESNKTKISLKKEDNDRELLKQVFEYYKEQGQIEFVTFHQSYGYEEFVEGIKAISPDDERNPTDNLIYKVEAGIFKKLCENAKIIKAQTNKLDFDWNRGNIFKMSLGGKSDSEILDWCLDNEYISMGWGNEIDFSSITAQSWESFRDKAKSLYQNLDTDRFTLQAMYAFKEWMKKDDLVFISLGNLKIVAIGQVIGDYEYKENIDEIRYSQFRKVKWLFIDKSGIPVEKLLNKKLSQQTIYNLDKSYVKKDFLDSLFIKNNDEQLKNYVLIIDEINRGNISKIFGELITLIEPSKRIGADEEIRVKLPYSGDSEEHFGVPQNLFIIGTMNTADRSIAPIDTALRRRFVFEEMAPNSSLLSKDKIKVQVSKDDETDTGIELNKLLEAINTRIEYLYDRDHTIGHAYLIDVETLDDLKFAFKNKIIPLLAEYFYEDWENIDLVLNNNGFIESKKDDDKYLSKKIQDRIRNKITYKVSDNSTWTKEHFISIYKKSENE